MPNQQKMQNYDYFDILVFDPSDRDPTPRSRSVSFRIAIRPQDRDQFYFRIAILGSDRDPKKIWIANSNTNPLTSL